MRCRKVRGWLDVYVEGRLDERRARRVEEHLRQCVRCEEEARAVRSVVRLLADLERRDLPAERWERMEVAVSREVRLLDRVPGRRRDLILPAREEREGDLVRGVYGMLVDHGRIAVPALILMLLCVLGGIYLDRGRGGSEDKEGEPLYSLYSAEEPQEVPSLYSANPVRYVR